MNTYGSHHRYNAVLLINNVAVVQVEELGLPPHKALPTKKEKGRPSVTTQTYPSRWARKTASSAGLSAALTALPAAA